MRHQQPTTLRLLSTPSRPASPRNWTGWMPASGGYSRIGGYRVFLVAIEYPIFQLVDRLFGVFK